MLRDTGLGRLRSSTCIQVGSAVRPDPSDDQVSDWERSFWEKSCFCVLTQLVWSPRVFIGKFDVTWCAIPPGQGRTPDCVCRRRGHCVGGRATAGYGEPWSTPSPASSGRVRSNDEVVWVRWARVHITLVLMLAPWGSMLSRCGWRRGVLRQIRCVTSNLFLPLSLFILALLIWSTEIWKWWIKG